MRRLGRILIFCLAVLAGLAALALLAAPIVLERMAIAELQDRGIQHAELNIGTPGVRSAIIRDLRIGADEALRAEAVEVRYRPSQLLHGRIDGIRLVKPRLRIAIGPSGEVSFGSLDPLLSAGSGGGPVGPPAPLEIEDGSILLATPAGEFAAKLDGSVTLEPSAGPLRIALNGPFIAAELKLAFSQQGDGLRLAGEVANARISHPMLAVEAVTGNLFAIMADRLTASADLTLADLRSPFLELGSGPARGHLTARYEPGAVSGDIRLSGASDAALEAHLAGDPAATVQLTMSGKGLTVPETLLDGQLDLAADLHPAERRLQLTAPARLAGRIDPALRAKLPAPLAQVLTEAPATLTAGAGTATQHEDGVWSATGRLELTQGEVLRLAGEGEVVSREESLTGAVSLDGAMQEIVLNGIKMRGLALSGPLEVNADASGMQLRLKGHAPLVLRSLEFGETRFQNLSLPLEPLAAGRPVLEITRTGTGFALALGSLKAKGRFGLGPVTLGWSRATVEGRAGAALNAAIESGRVELPELAWIAEGIAAQLAAADGAAEPPAIEITIASLRSTAASPPLVPLRIEGRLRPEPERLRFNLTGRDKADRLRLSLQGSHRFGVANGSAKLTLEPLSFAAGLQPRDVFPALGDAITDAAGTLSLGGELSWSGKGLMSDLRLGMDDLSFVSPFGPVLGLNGEVRLDGLAPPSTPPGQRVTAKAVQAALPMTDLVLQFQIMEGRYLIIEKGNTVLAGGEVSIEPGRLDRTAALSRTRLIVRDVEVSSLFDLVGLDGLSATGRLTGSIPVAFGQGDVAIEKAMLASQEPGQIRYDPGEPPAALKSGGQSVGMALAALRNFHYDRLTIDIDRAFGGETLIALHIAGKNPDFYGGYPVEFNLNLTGKLDQILTQGLAGYHLPETIQDKLNDTPEAAPAAPANP